ncbi:ribonuclease H-like domain-containing protein [Tanacetum coccineum]
MLLIVLNSDESYSSFFAQHASLPTTHDDEDHVQIDEDAMEEIDIRWQVAMITARIRKFMRKTGRSIDLKPKNGITFDKSKIECFNCQKLGFDAVNRDICFDALTGVEQDDWSIEREKQKELIKLKEREDFKVKLEKWVSNASVLQNEVLNKQRYVSDKSCIGFGIESSNSMESDISSGDETLTDSAENVSFTGIDELAIRNKVVNQEKTKSSQSAIDRNKVIIEDWVDSDDEETDVSESQKETAFNQSRVKHLLKTGHNQSKNSVGQESRTKGLGNKGERNALMDSHASNEVLPQTVKKGAMINPKQTWRPKGNYLDSVNRDNGSYTLKQFEYGNPEEDLKDYAIIDSGCSGSMTGDKDKLSDFKEFKGGYVAFGNDSKGGRISGKGTIKTSCLDFEKVSYVEELKFNLLSVSQICDKKHNVLFTDKECLILSPKFKFVDEDLVILRAPRKNDVYSLDLKNIIPSGGITCLVAKATEDEAVLWHRRLGHVNFKNINKLVKGNLVRGLPSKTFKLDHSCLACRKGKQHRASCKKIEERTVREPLELLHMDLFGPVSVESVNRKDSTVGVYDECSKFGRESLGTEFKNQLMNEFCAKKGIKREYSIARTPQQNGVAERKNRTLIEAARTMTPYDILMGRSPNISFMRPFGCSLTILNTLDHLGKFDGKSEEGYLLGYSTNSKGFRVYNRVTRKVQDCLHVNFLENQENQKGKGPDWMFDLDLLTSLLEYFLLRKENYADSSEQDSCDDVELRYLDDQQYICSYDSALHPEVYLLQKEVSMIAFEKEKRRISIAKGKEQVDSTFTLSTANTPPQSTGNTPTDSDDDIPKDGIFSTNSFDAEEGGVADYNNLDPTIDVPSTPTLRIHKIHPQSQIIGKSTAGVQTRRKLQDSTSNQHQALLSFIYKQNRTNHKDQQTCLFACFLSQEEPKKVSQALADESWVEAMQEELLQFKLQELPELKQIRTLFLAFALSWASLSIQMDVKKLSGTYGLHQAQEHGYMLMISSWFHQVFMVRNFEDLMQKEFKMSSMGELTFFLGLRVKQSNGDFKSLQVYHLHAVKRIFRYLKHQPKLGLWYPKDSPFHLEAFSDSDYAGDNHDRRSTSGGCQYLGRRLVSWQCKKQTIVAISSTEARIM